MDSSNIKKIDFKEIFGYDLGTVPEMSVEEKVKEIFLLVKRLKESFVEPKYSFEVLSEITSREISKFIGGITNQFLQVYTNIRYASKISRFLNPHGVSFYSKERIIVFRDVGILNAHNISHENVHAFGYVSEFHAQSIAYLSNIQSEDFELIQSSLAQRLLSQLFSLPLDKSEEVANKSNFGEIRDYFKFSRLRIPFLDRIYDKYCEILEKKLDRSLKLKNQNGICDYDRTFANFLHAIEKDGLYTSPV